MTTTDAPASPSVLTDPDGIRALDRLVRTLSPDQALWLSGYLAAVAGRGGPSTLAAPAPETATGTDASRLTVLFGTETGNARSVAGRLVRRATGAGLDARAVDMAEYRTRKLRDESFLALVSATHGEGDPPEGARGFFEFLRSRKAPRLDHVSFAVLGLGDSSYIEFCRAGQELDERLDELGARRIVERVDCDVDYEDEADDWIGRVVSALLEAEGSAGPEAPAGGDTGRAGGLAGILDIVGGGLPAGPARPGAPGTPGTPGTPAYSRRRPYPAEILESVELTGVYSDKETRHIELSIDDSGFEYEPGDSVGVIAENEDAVVDAVLDTLNAAPTDTVRIGDVDRPLGEALQRDLELTRITPAFLAEYAEVAGAKELSRLLEEENRSELLDFMRCRQVPDVLAAFPVPGLDPQRLADMLRRLQPRLYSIASSPRWSPDQVDLTVAVTRRTPDGKARNGVASSYMADRRRPGERLEIYLQRNEAFRPPADPDTPVIMIGAGTGIAPFRAFVQDREVTGASGRSWLIFGERRFREDFLYQTEWQRFLRDGVLTRMDVAFSRDQARKIYVQDRVRERGAEIHRWLEEGASVYVCGDARGMAPGVHEALVEVLAREGGRTTRDAEDRLRQMGADGRYQRDVY